MNAGTVDQHVGASRRYVDAGVDHVIVSLVDVADPGAIERYGDVIAACRPLVETVGDVRAAGPSTPASPD